MTYRIRYPQVLMAIAHKGGRWIAAEIGAVLGCSVLCERQTPTSIRQTSGGRQAYSDRCLSDGALTTMQGTAKAGSSPQDKITESFDCTLNRVFGELILYSGAPSYVSHTYDKTASLACTHDFITHMLRPYHLITSH